MRILITGAHGQLGRTLVRRWHGTHQLVATDRDTLDITDPAACDRHIGAARPDAVVHCAAHTAVDRCETERDAAFRLNADGAGNVAVACARHGAHLVAISTDYVFAGDLSRPYREDDATGPRTVYGASKLAGEELVRLRCFDACIARIAWLYGPGGPSFVHTMLKLGRQDAAPMGALMGALKVVDDQVGNPTSTDAVAEGLERLITARASGVVHLTCEGEATWFALARELFAATGIARPITPCTTAEFPRPAPRPANSRLEKAALRRMGLAPMPPWRDTLLRFLRKFPEG